MRAWRMVCIVLVVVAALLVLAMAAAQAEPGDGVGGLIERPYTAVFEIFMVGAEFAAEVPFSGETSDFDGLCSEPVDVVWRSRFDGIDSVFGRFTGTGITCMKAERGVDADGAPAMTGMRITDMKGPFALADGSAIDTYLIDMGQSFDAETGQITAGVFWATSGGGTGRFEGATFHSVVNCRWTSPEALMAGVEPELCALHGTIRYDPLAGQGP